MEDERKACFNSNVEGYGEKKLRYATLAEISCAFKINMGV